MRFPQIITSLLDTDSYKFSMGAAIMHHFPRSKARYQFINRGKTPFPDGFSLELREQIAAMCNLRLQPLEREFLEKSMWYLPPTYLDLLSSYQFNQAEVGITQNGSELTVTIEGYWYRTVLWEVPLMALISELFFLMTDTNGIDGKRRELKELNLSKALKFYENSVKFTDFGTRRRYSFDNQLKVCSDLKSVFGSEKVFMGTSNPLIAMKLRLPVLGTHAHEWVSGVSALRGYAHGNAAMMDLWSQTYEGNLGTALTDTFGTDAFLADFTTKYAKLWDGVRHDSGEPHEYVDKIVSHYQKLRIDPLSKYIVFSNALTTDLAIDLAKYSRKYIQPTNGIGTHFTNDAGVTPLNIVIKLVLIDGQHAIKLSDDIGKSVGDPKTVEVVRWMHHIPEPCL